VKVLANTCEVGGREVGKWEECGVHTLERTWMEGGAHLMRRGP
jgi:hypothetical protein